jgi:type VI secretion system protein ImpE
MEKAEALLKEGDLDACLAEVMERVRADGAAIAPRVFLFQLFCVLGQWERARRQLYVLKDTDASTVPMFEVYDNLLQCEQVRQAVFDGQRSPLIFGKPAQWTADLASAVSALAAGNEADAEKMRDQAFDAAPETAGTINSEPFEWLADADGRLGPVLEVFLNGHYYWVSVDSVASVSMEPPEDLRDLVWAPAEFKWANGGEAVGFIPVRYPGSESADDNRLKLSRLTEWDERSNNLVVGFGQRVLVTDTNDYALLAVNRINLDVQTPTEPLDFSEPDTADE